MFWLDSVLHDEAPSKSDDRRAFVNTGVTPSDSGGKDVLSELSKFIDSSSAHRNQFKAFIRVYSGIQQLLVTCERSIAKLAESQDGQHKPSNALCQIFVEYMRGLSSCLASGAVDEMRRMKSEVKERLSTFDAEIKRRSKELSTLNQNLERAEQTFRRGQTDIKSMHAKVLQPAQSDTPFPWSPLRLDDKDKQFERLQKSVSDQARIASDSEFTYNQLVSLHMSAYSRGTAMTSEMASLRRKMNRYTVKAVKEIGPKVFSEIQKISQEIVPRMQQQVEEHAVSLGDFGMRLCSIEASLSALAGADREKKISEMKSTSNDSSVIEYRAVQSYLAKQQGELTFSRNDRVDVIRKESSGWWLGRNTQGETGYFPSVLVAQRPAGAALPPQNSPMLSYRPRLSQSHSSGTWRSSGSTDERVGLIDQSAPFSFAGIVQFAYVGEGIVVEAGDTVDIERTASDKSVIVRTERGQIGTVPLKILTVKRRAEISQQENLSGLINWSSFP